MIVEDTHCLEWALFKITELIAAADEVDEGLFSSVHDVIKDLMYAENIFVALEAEDNPDWIETGYFRDEAGDSLAGGVGKQEFLGYLSGYVFRTGQALFARGKELKKLEKKGSFKIMGTIMEDWMGVPLMHGGKTFGVIVIQSYDPAKCFSDDDKNLLTFVSRHLSILISSKRAERAIKKANESLEARVQERTQELLGREKLQSALYQISNLSHTDENLDHFYSELQIIVGGLMFADNFFIALIEDEGKYISHPYVADSVDSMDTYARRPRDKDNPEGATETVIFRAEPILFVKGERETHDFKFIGVAPHSWLGVPLLQDGIAIGAIVVQSYDQAYTFTGEDRDLLAFVSNHISSALKRKQYADLLGGANRNLQRAHDELEGRVESRTKELSVANSELERTVVDLKSAEKLQSTLFQIAELANATKNISHFYTRVHRAVDKLINAENLYIALLDESRKYLEFGYVVDESSENYSDRESLENLRRKDSGKHGLAATILDTGEPMLLGKTDLANVDVGLNLKLSSWLGVPLKHGWLTIGVLVVQSYESGTEYTEKDRDLLLFVGQHISTAIQRKNNADMLEFANNKLKNVNDELEVRVKERTAELEAAQEQLVESAHQAGMSEIASGILHNLGNVLNSVNISNSELRETVRKSKLGSLQKALSLLQDNRGQLAEFLTEDPKGSKLIDLLDKIIAQLGTENETVVKLSANISKCADVIGEVIRTQQSYAKGNVSLENVLPVDIVGDALAMQEGSLENCSIKISKEFESTARISIQKTKVLNILINLLKNASEALERNAEDNRIISLLIENSAEGDIRITVADNGMGISEANLAKMFSHGFTTKKDGHGFGLHSCVNYAKQMGGSLTATSDGEGKGSEFTLRFPPASD